MTISTTTVSYGATTALTTLAQASSTALQLSNKNELNIINAQIQKQVASKIAALQGTTDAGVTALAQAQLTSAQNKINSLTALTPQFGHNANVLSDLTTQLAALQTAASSGDSTTFDNLIAQSNIDIADLTRIPPTAPFQPDQVSTLKLNGLNIGSSASYDLSTPDGQTAAAAAVKSAQNLIGQIFQVTTSNQLLATSLTTALSTQVNSLNSQISNQQTIDQTTLNNQITKLSEQAANQLHLIELALGNTQTVATALAAAMNPVQPVSSVFEALGNGAAGNTTNTGPAILSLLT